MIKLSFLVSKKKLKSQAIITYFLNKFIMDKPYDKFNIMVLGDEKVGKTTILERY